MQPVDAVIDDGTNPGCVERRRIPGVLPPGGRSGVGVVGDREGQPAVPMRADDLAQPREPAGRRCRRRTEQEQASIGARLNEPICLFDGRGDRLLGIDMNARLQAGQRDLGVYGRGREVDGRVEIRGGEHRLEVGIGPGSWRPALHCIDGALRGTRSWIAASSHLGNRGVFAECRKVSPMRDIAASHDTHSNLAIRKPVRGP